MLAKLVLKSCIYIFFLWQDHRLCYMFFFVCPKLVLKSYIHNCFLVAGQQSMFYVFLLSSSFFLLADIDVRQMDTYYFEVWFFFHVSRHEVRISLLLVKSYGPHSDHIRKVP